MGRWNFIVNYFLQKNLYCILIDFMKDYRIIIARRRSPLNYFTPLGKSVNSINSINYLVYRLNGKFIRSVFANLLVDKSMFNCYKI